MDLKQYQAETLKEIRHLINTYDGTNFDFILEKVNNIINKGD
jgi:hypothetical protein